MQGEWNEIPHCTGGLLHCIFSGITAAQEKGDFVMKNVFKTKLSTASLVLIPACIGINYLGKLFASVLKAAAVA